MIEFDCPECGSPIRAKSRMAGSGVECDACKSSATVPGETPEDVRSKLTAKPVKAEDTFAAISAVGMFAVGAVVLCFIGYGVYLFGFKSSSGSGYSAGGLFQIGDIRTIGIHNGSVGPVCVVEDVVDSIVEAHKRNEARSIAVGHRDRGNAVLLDGTDRVRIVSRWRDYVRVEVLDGTHQGAFGYVHASWVWN